MSEYGGWSCAPHLVGRLARGVARRRVARCDVARRGVVGGQRGGEAVRVDAGPDGDAGQGGRVDRAGGQQVPGLQPLEPQRRPAHLAAGLGQGGPVHEQPRPPAVAHDGVADRRAVARLVADPLPGPVHQHTGQQGGRRAEEAPDRDPVQERRRAPGGGAEPNAAAVIARCGERQATACGRRVRAHHRPVRGETAGRHDHAARRPHPQRASVPPLQPAHGPVQDSPGLRHVQVRLDRPAVQDPVRQPDPAGRVAQGQAFHADDPAVGIGDQLSGGGLREHPGAGAPDGGGQPGVQQAARGAPATGPVPARRGRPSVGIGSVGGGQFAAGVVQVVPVGRIRRLVRAQTALERHAVPLQPGQHGHAAVAELLERAGRHRVADLGAQVAEHRVGRVGHAGRALLRRAAAGVDDAAGQRGGAAAAEPVEDQHRAAGRGRLQGRAGARGPEAHHDHVGLDVPVARH